MLRLHRFGEMVLEVEENVPETGMSVEVESEEVVGASETLYCFCRKPWGKDFMIMCDNCKEWLHGRLVSFKVCFSLFCIRPNEKLNNNSFTLC